jgi:RNA polymerase sigma-70 factor (ECF subfamily)
MTEANAEQEYRFEQILHETQDVVRAYVAGLGVAPGEVDDIAQEVYLAYHRGKESVPADVEPIRWLKGIAKRQCMNHFRRMRRDRARRMETIAELLSQADEPGEDETFLATAFGALGKCMEALSDKSRQLLRMKYQENLDAPAIAAASRMNSGAVRMTLLRIRETLRNCVAQNMGEAGVAHG